VISTAGRRVERSDHPSEYFGAWKSAVAFDGTNYLVAWTDQSGNTTGRIYAARVSPAGAVLDPSGILIASAAGVEQPPALAFDGTNYLVAWADSRAGCCAIYGARVSPSGSVLDPNGIAISSGPNGYAPVLGFDATNYLVVWQQGARLFGARVSPAGSVLDPNGFAISAGPGSQSSPVLAFDGTNYLVAWSDCRPPTCVEPSFYPDIYGTRVTPEGTVLDPEGIAISDQFFDETQPAISFDGTNYLVAWLGGSSDNSRIMGARVTPAGTVLDPSGIVIATSPFKHAPAVAFDGTNYLVAWEYTQAGWSNIYGARVTPSGTLLDPDGIPISTAPYHQSRPALAFDGKNYLVAWADNRSSTEYEIYGARVGQSGAVLDPEGLPISPHAHSECAPALAFDGTNYLVTWQQRSGGDWNVYAARVSPEGTVLDPEGIPISTAPGDQWSPAVAFDGTNFLVVWEDRRSGYDIYASRVTPTGTVLDPAGIPISTDADYEFEPTVAFDGTNFLAAWTDIGSAYGVFAARVSPAGTVLDPAGIRIAFDAEAPTVAFDGTNYLLAWQANEGDTYEIHGGRVSPAGTVLDPGGFVISAPGFRQDEPAIAFDGTNYLVAWNDTRGPWDVYGSRVSQAGTVLDPAGIPIGIATNVQQGPTIAFDGTNYLVAWQDVLLRGDDGARLRAHWKQTLAPGCPPLELPTDRPRRRSASSIGATCAFSIDPATTGALRAATARSAPVVEIGRAHV